MSKGIWKICKGEHPLKRRPFFLVKRFKLVCFLFAQYHRRAISSQSGCMMHLQECFVLFSFRCKAVYRRVIEGRAQEARRVVFSLRIVYLPCLFYKYLAYFFVLSFCFDSVFIRGEVMWCGLMHRTNCVFDKPW